MKLIVDLEELNNLDEATEWDSWHRYQETLTAVIKNSPREICILIIAHRHGQDVHASTSEGRLMEFLAEFCRQYWDEERANLDVDWLPQEAPEDDIALIQQYFCMAREESWDIHTLIEIE